VAEAGSIAKEFSTTLAFGKRLIPFSQAFFGEKPKMKVQKIQESVRGEMLLNNEVRNSLNR